MEIDCFRSQRYKTFESYSQQPLRAPAFTEYCFRSQRYKTFESYSQHGCCVWAVSKDCFRSQRYKTFESYSQRCNNITYEPAYCFRPQRYKTFESYSQLVDGRERVVGTVSDRKDTKLLKAIHNSEPIGNLFNSFAVLVMAARMDFRLLSIPC